MADTPEPVIEQTTEAFKANGVRTDKPEAMAPATSNDEDAESHANDSEEADGSEEDKVEVDVEPGSCMEYKCLDEVWDLDTNEWVLRDSGPVRRKSNEDKYRQYSFTVVRTLHRSTFAVAQTMYV